MRDTGSLYNSSASMMSFQCSFFCHPSSPYDVIPVTISLSSQCPDTGMALLHRTLYW
ncbi:MAG: hypothetical protein ACEY3H_06040 [Wolbachia sp.]|uniref:hypothetical protein n=1 Tax=unclassified Wolbachia TaxID=2640676 RepID=UPI00222F8F5A|nr:hypothetical protein [Wolbachia endosymbiont (group A) of Tiphia femorata]